ncbi:MAG: hypothetical protein RL021_988 [Bacteroidota bacterium]|jgi:exopolyphosphatase/guanosine-5'-triphosphate,3'-diphosphate pyrophosphatase
MSRTVAVLDLGTNTFHLLVVRLERDGTWSAVHRSRKTVKLGEGAIHMGVIAPRPFSRGIKALCELKERAENFGVSAFAVVATSAVRSASNRSAFVFKALKETGLRIQVISGNREAELIASGVRQTLTEDAGRVLIMDIGGGSAEFILADHHRIFWKHSFDIGAARLLEQFRISDPIRKREQKALRVHLENELGPLFNALERYPASQLVSASGSAESFAKMIGYRTFGRDPLRNKRLHAIDLKAYLVLHRELMASTALQRTNMKGLVRMRTEMIVPASILTEFVLRRTGIKSLSVSAYSLKEGVATLLARGGNIGRSDDSVL